MDQKDMEWMSLFTQHKSILIMIYSHYRLIAHKTKKKGHGVQRFALLALFKKLESHFVAALHISNNLFTISHLLAFDNFQLQQQLCGDPVEDAEKPELGT
jgi:hypothetical protein